LGQAYKEMVMACKVLCSISQNNSDETVTKLQSGWPRKWGSSPGWGEGVLFSIGSD